MSKTIKLYLDFISPYAWLAFRPLCRIAAKHDFIVEPVPILFAGLLKAHGQLGPAEISAKRLWLIKDVTRRAAQQSLHVQVPPTHPFKPLLSLRAASSPMSNQSRLEFVGNLLDAVWMHGEDISDQDTVRSIAFKSLPGADIDKLINDAISSEDIKSILRLQTETAIKKGVFGVPTAELNGELYWGSESDTMSHIESAMQGHDLQDHDAVMKWHHLQASAQRKR